MYPSFSLNCRGRIVSLDKPQVMGILNVTPDSFSDGGLYNTVDSALKQAEKMLREGASILDIGGYSTRPNAQLVTADEEIKRLYPVIEALLSYFPSCILSIDTFRASVAKSCLEIGAHIINDISGGTFDDAMYQTVANYDAPYILMHLKGNIQTMHINPTYQNIIEEIITHFVKRINIAKSAGVREIILDAGFGFSKTLSHNYELFERLQDFEVLQLPMLVGISRKSMLYKLLDTSPNEVLPFTTALHLKALEKGAKIIRTHDVKEAVGIIRLHETLAANSY